MRLTRVYVDMSLAQQTRIDLPASSALHLAKVLRNRAGDELVLFNGDGAEYAGRIDAIRGSKVSVTVGAASRPQRESPLHSTLAQCIARGERMDFVVQKATELGVTRILPLFSTRSLVRLDARQAAAKVEHWRAVAQSACEQCGRNRLPVIEAPRPLLAYLDLSIATQALRLFMDPNGAALQMAEHPAAAEILIGPEGGFAPEEIEAIRHAQIIGVRLGPRVLRTETAALVAMTWLQARFGDLRNLGDSA